MIEGNDLKKGSVNVWTDLLFYMAYDQRLAVRGFTAELVEWKFAACTHFIQSQRKKKNV